jgi:hypothetical protein
VLLGSLSDHWWVGAILIGVVLVPLVVVMARDRIKGPRPDNPRKSLTERENDDFNRAQQDMLTTNSVDFEADEKPPRY